MVVKAGRGLFMFIFQTCVEISLYAESYKGHQKEHKIYYFSFIMIFFIERAVWYFFSGLDPSIWCIKCLMVFLKMCILDVITFLV